MVMKLNTSGTDDAITRSVIKEIKNCNIGWTDITNSNTAMATIVFNKKGNTYEASINVNSNSGKPVVINEKMLFRNAEGAGEEIALRLFGKGGAMVYEAPE
jgi:hypothetical protein